MSSFLYKYCNENLYNQIFSDNDTFSLKFSSLKDFNDPYEFFLTIDYNVSSEELATYKDILDMHLNYVATCFSKIPVNTPMWAHYASDFKGFVLELDEGVLSQYLQEQKIWYLFENIQYKNKPSDYLNNRLAYATRRGKPRDYYFFESAILKHAYFTKQTCWKYEKEKRLIIPQDAVQDSTNEILWFPMDAIKSIIIGNKASDERKDKLKNISRQYGINYYEIKPSKISLNPFFIDINKKTFKFSTKGITKARYYCKKCNEPLKKDEEYCSWCKITERTQKEAKMKNAYRILNRYNMLEEYIKRMDAITMSINKNN